jgi:hypothetical protein
MQSTRQPFVKSEHCTVINSPVSLSGIRVVLGDAIAITKKSCSNVAKCLEKSESLEKIPSCLLHNLNG